METVFADIGQYLTPAILAFAAHQLYQNSQFLARLDERVRSLEKRKDTALKC